MAQEIAERIRSNPKFWEFVKKRNNYSIVMTILGAVAYYGFILLVAYNKEFLSQKVATGAVMSIGIPIGVGVIVFTIILTWIFVNRSNGEFDTERTEIIKEATK